MPLLWVFDQKLQDEVFGIVGDVAPVLAGTRKVAIGDEFDGVLDSFALEGHLAQEHDVEDDADTPHIAFFVVLSSKNFGSDVLGRTAFPTKFSVDNPRAQAPVDDLHDPFALVFFDEYVFGLEVAVGDALGVGVVDPL